MKEKENPKISKEVKGNSNIEKEESKKLKKNKTDKENKAIDSDKKNQKIIIGTFQQSPNFLKDNEYIQNGYVINCFSFKRAIRCLFLFHNETMNTWTHLLGAIFFIFLFIYTIFFIKDFKTQLDIIKQDLPLIEQKSLILYEQFSDTKNIYNSIKNIQESFYHYIPKRIYSETINNIFLLYNNTKKIISSTKSSIINYTESLLESLLSLKKQTIDLINLDEPKNEELKSYLDSGIKNEIKHNSKKELNKIPLYFILICIILCLTFSCTYHALKIISPIFHNISHRFDHGGISLLISGSCVPPYYYFFYHENKFKYFYLIEIVLIGFGIFIFTITSSDFSKPHKRAFRGVLFILFGITTGIPVIHMTFFGDTIKGYKPGAKFNNWYYGGISYIFGAILYILRFPEKKFRGKFDYIGSSHQLFHVFVLLGALFHFFGSLDAYKYRFKNLEI